MAISTAAAPRRYRSLQLGRLGRLPIVIPGFLVVWSLMVVLPLLVVVAFSFFQVKYYKVVYQPSLDAWISLFTSGRWLVAVRTLRIALTMTAIELFLAFPFGLWLAKGCRSVPLKAFIITLLTIPFFLDPSSRTIVWRAILGSGGLINSGLMHLGVINAPIEWLLYSEFAVHFGMIGSYFPTMVFPIFMIMSLIDDEYLQASADLGASPGQTLVHVIMPLAIPGVMAGIIFTLVPLMAAFVEPQMLGGGFVNLLGDSVDSALRELKYPTAAALSTVVVAILAFCLLVLILMTRKRFDFANMFTATHR
ncbi:putative spermidine/putrescine transport system permease protein/spermidine/putrescine transport system permease protein [Arboricoccus pini]|uniref:Putative spermidine/putrescine transport system permease protein/spermidine/putrescine transport system permease protein n=1 Tax=Arboricoccus pini TaxID=1963835 RepID=A0A212RIU3_9PROT|nr:ABC transporter permease [Arboricoccus pini]SNB72343.1 putative spermidine/putrescine transport system permease protein/spermidine/putrescine transport system permease protein [Arboricoccus pini]